MLSLLETDKNNVVEHTRMTRRKLKERIKEHILNFVVNPQVLNFNQNITRDFDEAKIIYPTSNDYTSIIIEILCKSNPVGNDTLFPISSHFPVRKFHPKH